MCLLKDAFRRHSCVRRNCNFSSGQHDRWLFCKEKRPFFESSANPRSRRIIQQAAWNGKTIQYIENNVGPSLDQRPNIILLHAGTNDMNPDSSISTEGNSPVAASLRLGSLIDKMIASCPDAVILVAMILGTCNADQAPQTETFQSLVPGVVMSRFQAGERVLPVDFSTFALSNLRDCIHPTNQGYQLLGDYWYNFVTQIPKDWITEPVGDDPKRQDSLAMHLGTNMPLLVLLGSLFVLMHM